MSILSGNKKEADRLLQENDDLRNKLHTVLEKQGGFEELEKKLALAKKELSDIANEQSQIENNIHEMVKESDQKKKTGATSSHPPRKTHPGPRNIDRTGKMERREYERFPVRQFHKATKIYKPSPLMRK